MRCYNGCPDSELQALIDKTKAVRESVRKIEPEAHCTYHHPDEYIVHVWGREIGHSRSQLGAWEDALKVLQNKP